MIKSLLQNWKTTYAGLGMIVAGIVHLIYSIHAHGLTESDCTTTLMAIIAGIGLVAAGDAGVSVQKTDVQTDSKTGFLMKSDTQTKP